jgi:hypothetical protein
MEQACTASNFRGDAREMPSVSFHDGILARDAAADAAEAETSAAAEETAAEETAGEAAAGSGGDDDAWRADGTLAAWRVCPGEEVVITVALDPTERWPTPRFDIQLARHLPQ